MEFLRFISKLILEIIDLLLSLNPYLKRYRLPKYIESIEVKKLRESQKAIYIVFNEFKTWLPKSQIIIKEKKEGENLIIQMPEWLFYSNFA